jgi:transposase InsO family protein
MDPEAGDGARTHDPQLGKLMLYQLSYAREARILAVPDSFPLLRAKKPLCSQVLSHDYSSRVWVADITYLRTWNGFVYLAFILDCYSRMIVGWQLATRLRTELVMDAMRDNIKALLAR